MAELNKNILLTDGAKKKLPGFFSLCCKKKKENLISGT